MKFGIAFSCALAMLASPVAAQSVSEHSTGSAIKKPEPARSGDRVLTEEQRGRDMMNRFARCVVDVEPKLIAEAIALQPGQDGPVLAKAATSKCLEGGGEMRFGSPLMRGAVFGELYRRSQENGGAPLPKFSVSPVDLTTLPGPENAALSANWFLLWLSDCLAKTNRNEMHAIVTSRTATDAQKAAYAVITPALGPCIPQGQTMTLSRAMLEAGFGEYLYRSLSRPVAAPGN